jgi:hypothetical protein
MNRTKTTHPAIPELKEPDWTKGKLSRREFIRYSVLCWA